ncbi:MAG: Uma2 family endonuclease [Planctomycetes bacterium]|nr:Uma2 family endonuclease [Planctomycetota bacterium]
MTARDAALILEPERVRLPANLSSLELFRRWAHSERFPERGRIDWVAGEVRIDMSPEDLNTHAAPKMAIARDLSNRVEGGGRGMVFVDRARLTDLASSLSSEPDVLVVFFESIEAGRVRLVQRASKKAGRFIEVQGAADLVVECVSDSSEEKDRLRLPPLYCRAGVREYWLVDARKAEIEFVLNRRVGATYKPTAAGADGFYRSAVLGKSVRLVRLRKRAGLVPHRLEIR